MKLLYRPFLPILHVSSTDAHDEHLRPVHDLRRVAGRRGPAVLPLRRVSQTTRALPRRLAVSVAAGASAGRLVSA